MGFLAASFAEDGAVSVVAAAAEAVFAPAGEAFGFVGAGFSDSGTGDGVRS